MALLGIVPCLKGIRVLLTKIVLHDVQGEDNVPEQDLSVAFCMNYASADADEQSQRR